MKELKTALIAVIAFTVVLGLAYPLAMTGVAQVVFPGRADGSMIERDGNIPPLDELLAELDRARLAPRASRVA